MLLTSAIFQQLFFPHKLQINLSISLSLSFFFFCEKQFSFWGLIH